MKVLNQIKLHTLFFFLKINSLIYLSAFITKFIRYVSQVLYTITNRFLLFSWYLVTAINLSLRIDRKADCFLEIVYIHFRILNKKKFNIFWYLHINEENYFVKARKMFQILEKIILKKLRFRIPVKFEKEKINTIFPLYYFKKIRKLKLLYNKIKQKKEIYYYIKQPMDSFLSIPPLIWYNLKILKDQSFPWWRYFNIRETELEYYDQIITFAYSSTGLKL
jgi:hypothetical protein